MSDSYQSFSDSIFKGRYFSKSNYLELQELNQSVDLFAENWFEQLKKVYLSIYTSGNMSEIDTHLKDARFRYLNKIEPKKYLSEDQLIYMLSKLGLLVNDYHNFSPKIEKKPGSINQLHKQNIGSESLILESNNLEKINFSDKSDNNLGNSQPKRAQILTERIVRDSKVSKTIKEIYDYSCQVCQIKLITKNGSYAEGAHIVPLGGDDQGSDTLNNILCLCPNHHILFDNGAFVILDDFQIRWLICPEKYTILNVDPAHNIEPSFLWYHREKWT